jgi:hypothetical protein
MFNPQNLKKIVLALLALIVVVGSVGYFYYQRNIFGQDKIRFEIIAPEKIDAGDVVEYIVRYRNNSDVRLEEMTVVFEYPENSIPIEEVREEREIEVREDDEENEEGEEREENENTDVNTKANEEDEKIIKRGDYRREIIVGELNPGEEKTTTFKTMILGKEGDSFEATAVARYVPRNLAARYESKREHITVIENVPISFEFQVPSTADPQRETSIRLRFFSEIDHPLTDLEVRISYPAGFNFIRSTPQSEVEARNVWSWPVLNKGGDGTIDIDGVLRGDPGDARIFSAVLGVWVNDNFIKLKETSRGTAISRSNLLLDMQVNGRTDYVANPGELLHYEIFFRNIGEETLEELFLLVDLDGKTINLNQVEPRDGRFQEERGAIIWSHTFNYDLLSLKENEEGRVEFWARVNEELPYNPEIKIKASMERAEKTLEHKVNTVIILTQDIIRKGSPFKEYGPFPFEEGEISNYTVRWRIHNRFNDVRDVTLRTKIPQGARITGEKEPEDISLSFNSSTGEVIVDVERISAGDVKEIFFEVEIDPRKDFDEEDVLLEETSVTAEDRRTNSNISTTANAVFLDQVIEIID